MVEVLPAVDQEVIGISDVSGLQVQIDTLKTQLSAATQQIETERALAVDVHRARGLAVRQSPALRLVYGIRDDAETVSPTLNDENTSSGATDATEMLSAAFMTHIAARTLPDGFGKTVTRHLRRVTHPDTGARPEIAKEVGGALEGSKGDQTLAIVKALLVAPDPPQSRRELLIERHRLHLAVTSTQPSFSDVDEAREIAQREIEGAEWRVRTQAAFMAVELITGGNDVWHQFLQDIVSQGRMQLITLVNRVQPELSSIQERIVKGQPIKTDALDIQAIDQILERIWSTLHKDGMQFRPPYQNWLDILMPAIRALDPGQAPGEQYTDFQPPIRVTRTHYNTPPKYRSPYNEQTIFKNRPSYGGGIFAEDSIYNEERNYREY